MGKIKNLSDSKEPSTEKSEKKTKKNDNAIIEEKVQEPKKKSKKSVMFNLEENQEFEIEPRVKKQQKLNENNQQNGQSKSSLINSSESGRKWNQSQEEKQTGKFTDDEITILKEALCKYSYEKGLGESGLLKLVSEKATPETLGAWSEISECLPCRSVQSCHNFSRRRFNPNNYGGKWSEQETRQLIALVEEHGRKWKLIGQELGRTETNVRDKYKSIGEENSNKRKTSFWSLDEYVLLLKQVQELTGLKILKNRKQMKKEIKENGQQINEESEEMAQSRQRVRDLQQLDPNTKFLLNFINFEQFKNIKSVSIPWTKISETMKTKSYDDCKNKWEQYLLKVIFEYSGNYDGEDEEDLVQQIVNQDVDSETEIDFNKIENGKTVQENKMKWNILKKRVTSRQNVAVPEILQELVQQLKQSKKQKAQSISQEIIKNSSSELLNYFKQNYLE